MNDASTSSRAAAAWLQGGLDAGERLLTLIAKIDRAGEPVRSRAYEAVGPHVRHCIDHVECMLRGLRSESDDGADADRVEIVDYDARDRDARLECSIAAAREVVERQLGDLAALRRRDPNAPITVRSTASADGSVAEVRSSLGRELAFLSSHTIHHIAIAVLLANAAGLEAPASLGTAYSTSAWRAGAGERDATPGQRPASAGCSTG